MRLGDFLGDGRTDVLRAVGDQWQVKQTGGPGQWVVLRSATSTAGLDGLRLGNFIGDPKTDIIRANGSTLEVSQGGAGPWTAISSSDFTPNSFTDLRFLDWNGDGATDVFRILPASPLPRYQVAYGGNGTLSAWDDSMARSAVPITSLKFGDFIDGDLAHPNQLDTFRMTGGGDLWQVVVDGRGKWTDLRSGAGAAPLASLRLGDFSCGGKTDVLRVKN